MGHLMNMTDADVVAVRESYRGGLNVRSQPKSGALQIFVGTVGLVGAGKTTVIKPLAEKLSLVRISSDEVRKIMKERGFGYERLMDIVAPLAEELAAEGHSLAFDADCGSPKTKELILKIAAQVGAKIFWIRINPPEDFILNKLRSHEHTWLFKDGDEAVDNYLRQKERRAQENTPFDFLATVDTSKPDLAAQIDRIFGLIEKSR